MIPLRPGPAQKRSCVTVRETHFCKLCASKAHFCLFRFKVSFNATKLNETCRSICLVRGTNQGFQCQKVLEKTHCLGRVYYA